ncbi:dTDP-4-dehydrorhamnose 3,5-epimerase [Roseospira visakhapatnamensis]|uniref:dTDP-4-dehydrorhamnose 3,5-epimerase n=1 Tax=Roseospira visakhapatnamensis TaxID=390880 RepID=A0A7W6WAL4_9PROT|nr:dTDP-4-dehydrorhamnose 3,5-epimerase [Roseospira visakhapatnamensis]MBB4266627.1 dTDP-4-dehydrorhamnose 3,5-epimerase [Roseospira visakhapatnamensis]
MQVTATDIPEVKLITPRLFGDHRGFFSETYNRRALAEAGITLDFVQDNHSKSARPGTLRGLHFQTPPASQAKLVRVVRGAVWDVAVDLRQGSPTFGRWVGAELSAENWTQILVPAGFAHGFVTLLADTEVEYKVTAYYAPDHDKGLAWNDPDLAIDWPLPPGVDQPILSDKDTRQPRFAELPSVFTV